MKPTRLSSLALVPVLLLAACQPAGDLATPAETAVASLDELLDEVWERRLERDLSARIFMGLPVESLPDLTFEAAGEDTEFARGVLTRLEAIDADALPHARWLDYRVLERDAEMTIEGHEHYWFTNVLTPYSSPLAGLSSMFAGMSLEAPEDVDRYLSVLSEVPELIEQVERHVRAQAEVEIVVPEPNQPAVSGLVRAIRQPAEGGPFDVDEERLAALDREQTDRLRVELARLVESEINPALERLESYLTGEYAAAAPEQVGLDAYGPAGDDYYRYLVRRHTTMEVTPEQVQAIGYEMVGEMQARMADIQAEIGFEGSADEFRELVRDDPDNYPSSPEEVAEGLMSAADAFYARADEFFLTMPEAPYGVKRLDPSLEGSQTYGYYNPGNESDPTGYYYFNGSRLDQRSKLPIEGLAYHELFPGHHYHIARQLENEALHDHRKSTFHGAYTEGWGSYSSYLGLESGLLDDPLQQYGLYMLEIFLATRLVVDPGMNAFDMTLEQARDFMTATTFESPTQVATESLRYSTDMPGQALAYQMGKRRLLELRARAEAELGDAFDLRAFHEAVLEPGSLPMTVLEEHIEHWLSERLAQR